MKSLVEQVQDLRDTATILVDMANQLEQLAIFFGGSTAIPATSEPREPAIKKVRGATKASEGKRELQPAEIVAIKADWNALGEHLRTRENRAALARKYQCSPLQIQAVCNAERLTQARAVALSKKS